ncbi:Rok-like winged helix domain-containing protein [Bacillus changyiensis]|uniref:Rok-like winged helix domain-containing protein n=1 Tax=Bacillus changyiensis TaxID=3004103 RepID=UPI0022DF05F6|nr:hypothetical protein [Bacillus changyiensis]MDA1475246.1 hypothetical protein [Bacillus changyiensis]
MFNERDALRLRLEQLNHTEITVIREFQKERNQIYAKLRELDGANQLPSVNKKSSLIELASATAQKFKEVNKHSETEKSSFMLNTKEQIHRSKTSIHREAALKVLNTYKEGIRGTDLRVEIEKETGIPIMNMTTFMQGLMKHHPEVKKPDRGRYMLSKEQELISEKSFK